MKRFNSSEGENVEQPTPGSFMYRQGRRPPITLIFPPKLFREESIAGCVFPHQVMTEEAGSAHPRSHSVTTTSPSP